MPTAGSRALAQNPFFCYPPSTLFLHMSQDYLIKLECTECHRVGYQSHKNKKTIKARLELAKFCRWCRKHVTHKETK